MRRLNGFDWITIALLIVGGINWGLMGFLNLDIVASIFGPVSTITRMVYIIIGFCAFYILLIMPRIAKP